MRTRTPGIRWANSPDIDPKSVPPTQIPLVLVRQLRCFYRSKGSIDLDQTEFHWPRLPDKNQTRSVNIPFVPGLISQYNSTELPKGTDHLPLLMGKILTKRIKIQGFIIFDDYGHRYNEFAQDMNQWLAEGKIQYREHLVDGLESAPDAFIGLLQGKNFGKLVVQVNQPL